MVEHRPFQVDPDLPFGVQDKISYLRKRLGADAGALDGMIEACKAMFTAAGLPALRRDGQTGNSFDCHRLLSHAATLTSPVDAQERLLHALFTQYFHHGRSMSDHDALLAAVAEAAIDVDAARAVLESDAYADVVRDHIATARAQGIQSVPFFQIGDRPGFGGSDTDFGAIFAGIATGY